jgi:hypothetical protein
MIQLATAPTASRTGTRPDQDDAHGKSQGFEARRGRIGHAWPFPSRYSTARQTPQSNKPVASDSGS